MHYLAKSTTLLLFAIPVAFNQPVSAQTPTPDVLAQGFTSPPATTRPRCYWYWMDGKITKEGITRDLEGMARVGIGEAYIGIIGGQSGDTGPGGVTSFTEEWWQLVEHAIREAGRVGVDIGMFNGPGWSQSGGPWVKPEQAMRHVVTSEVHVKGPQHFEATVARPNGAIQDIATLAFPAPAADTDSIGAHSPKFSGGDNLARLFDGDRATSAPIPPGNSITVEVASPYTARSVTLYPARGVSFEGELQVSDDGTTFRGVRKFVLQRTNLSVQTGPEPLAPVSVAFPATTGRFFRIVFSNGGELSEIALSGAARVDDYARKKLGKMFQGSQPPFDYYTWPKQAEPENDSFAVPTNAVQNISSKLVGDKLTWDVPAGDWLIQRLAMSPTGVHNVPAPPDATGLEVDKMSREHLRSHFDAFIGQLLKRMPAADRKAFKHVVVDSYETGSENWTDGFATDFKARYGYDATPFLPVLSGRIVGNADQSNRFLWDLRRYVADRVAFDYVGGLRDLSREHGLKAWLENYGHAGFFGEFLQYGGQTEELGGEFWAEPENPVGNIELRDASSAAHIYGLPVTYAEAWTGGPAFSNTPSDLKLRGDWAYCQGISQFVLHLVISQPDERRPGISAWFGTEFNRHNTWFNQSKNFFDYLTRSQFMLQQGKSVADVAYFIGEDTPKMSGLQQPALPYGYSYDFINADVINNRLKLKNGRFTLPDGMSYRLIVIPDGVSIRPETLKKLRDLVAQGGAVWGTPPTKSPSLQNYPACDTEIAQLANQLWAKCDGVKSQSAVFGKGRVFRGAPLATALQQLNTPPDVVAHDATADSTLFVHRRSADADIYFISNQSKSALDIAPSFRVTGRAPELWNPETGARRPLAFYDSANGQTRVPLHLEVDGSVFVVFRGKSAPIRITNVSRDGKLLAQASPYTRAQQLTSAISPRSGTFTVSMWAKPTVETPLFSEVNTGIIGLGVGRNDVIYPVQGEFYVPGYTDAGMGIAVGTNGVTVFEHGAEYFVPILSKAIPITDWTHIAVVYNAGLPQLYINGALVHTGLKSTRAVHPGEPNRPFAGTIRDFARVSRALSPSEIVALAKSPVPTSNTVEEVILPQLTPTTNGAIQVLAWQPGTYNLQRSNGKPLSFSMPPLMPSTQLGGVWTVAFPANSGAPTATQLDSLASLTTNPDPTIKYFSGTATYTKNFDIPASALAADKRLYLDLGQVASIAEVTFNGKNVGTLWKAPFQLDITSFAKVGPNQLEVRVTNAWHNRLVGQRLAPDAFKSPGTEQLWASVFPNYGPGEPLFPSGLIGPVTLRQASALTLR
ncbi:hypothetical protein EON83_27855 [bacterium]|nr:MAG: hypothetical protein EON83_27855 [bacterium]